MSQQASPMQRYWFGKRNLEHADAWFEFYKAVTKKGVLDAKTKELIAVAAGVLSRCEHCVEAHANAAFKAGASKEEVAEAVMVAAQTASGSHLFWSPVYEKLLGDDGGGGQ